MLGAIAFTRTIEGLQLGKYQQFIDPNYVYLASLLIYVTYASVDRSVNTPTTSVIMDSGEISALVGLSISAIAYCDNNIFGVLCTLKCVGILIFSFHRRKIFPILVIPLLIILNMKTILNCESGIHAYNRESLSLFCLILISGPLLNVFFSKTPSINTWLPVLREYISIIFEIFLYSGPPDPVNRGIKS